MPIFAEHQVRCCHCEHVHDEDVEWLLGHREVVCPSCGGQVPVELEDLITVVETPNTCEVFDLSQWSPEKSRESSSPQE